MSKNSSPPTSGSSGGVVPSGSASGGSGARARKGTSISPNYGVRKIRYYAITEAELNDLFWISVIVTICFSLFWGGVGYTFDVIRDITLEPDTPQNFKVLWIYSCVGVGVFSISALIVGIILFFAGRNKISQIKTETKF